jgi:type IV pilus assembly protein PilX
MKTTMKSVLVLRRQSGSSLVISLLLMIALVLVAFASANSSLFQERMAGNVRDRSSAFNAAEAGLRDAEQYMREKEVLPVFDGTDGHFKLNQLGFALQSETDVPATSSTDDVSTEEIWASKKAIDQMRIKGRLYGTDTARSNLPNVPEQPRYTIEEMPQQPGRMMSFRITSVGFGPNDSVVVLQTYYTPPQFTVI